MNIVTKQDLKRFIELSKIGMKDGRKMEIRNYSSASNVVDGTDVATEYYISLELSFRVDADKVDDLIEKENFGHDLDDILKGLD